MNDVSIASNNVKQKVPVSTWLDMICGCRAPANTKLLCFVLAIQFENADDESAVDFHWLVSASGLAPGAVLDQLRIAQEFELLSIKQTTHGALYSARFPALRNNNGEIAL